MAALSKPASVYNAPNPDAAVQDELLETLLLPMDRSDQGWLRVEYLDVATREWRFGWLTPLAAGQVRSVQERYCPPPDDAAQVLSTDPTDGPACFGDTELPLGPVFIEREPVPGAAFQGDPWLASVGELKISAHPGGDSGALLVNVAPEVQGAAAPRSWISIRGHFDDPRSETCAREPVREPFQVESPAEQVMWCRQQFVITASEPAPAPTP